MWIRRSFKSPSSTNQKTQCEVEIDQQKHSINSINRPPYQYRVKMTKIETINSKPITNGIMNEEEWNDICNRFVLKSSLKRPSDYSIRSKRDASQTLSSQIQNETRSPKFLSPQFKELSIVQHPKPSTERLFKKNASQLIKENHQRFLTQIHHPSGKLNQDKKLRMFLESQNLLKQKQNSQKPRDEFHLNQMKSEFQIQLEAKYQQTCSEHVQSHEGAQILFQRRLMYSNSQRGRENKLLRK